MKYALIDNGAVANIIVAEADFAASIAGEHQAVVDVTETAAMIGDSYHGGLFLTSLRDIAVSEGDKLSLSVNAHSTLGGLTYQWKKGGAPIGGATEATYSIDPAAPGDAGSYTCVVSDGTNTVESAPSTVTVA